MLAIANCQESSYVFDEYGLIDGTNHKQSPASNTVYVYFATREGERKNVELGKKPFPAYDLGSMARVDLCLQIKGRNMAMQGFTSNTFKFALTEQSLNLE